MTLPGTDAQQGLAVGTRSRLASVNQPFPAP